MPRKSVGTTAVASILIAAVTVQAQSAPDWRYLGASANMDSYVFYDASSVQKLDHGHSKAWMKGLPMAAFAPWAKANSVDELERIAAAKAATGYVPPVGLTQKLSQKDIVIAVILEKFADEGSVHPQVQVLVEVDCPNRMFRDLSWTIIKGGEIRSSEKVGEWEHIPPENNIATLHAALCR